MLRSLLDTTRSHLPSSGSPGRPVRRRPQIEIDGNGSGEGAEHGWGALGHLRAHAQGQQEGLARLPAPEDAVAFAQEIREPDRYEFTTPSGKIEVHSMALAANPDPYGLGAIPPIPKHGATYNTSLVQVEPAPEHG